MPEAYHIIIAIGGILMLSMIAETIGRRTALPRVTLLLAFGIIIGHQGLDLVPASITTQFDLIANITLIMIGFLLGGQFTPNTIQENGKQIVLVTFGAAVGAMVFVFLGLYIAGLPLAVAVLLACLSSATDPAATTDVIMENEVNTPFSRLLLAVVPLDDLVGLFLFSLGLSVVSAILQVHSATSPLVHAIYDIAGAVLLGTFIGVPAAYLTGRIKPGKPIVSEALGLVLLCGGLALVMNVSFLIASMTMGAMVRNLASHHEHAFHDIENVELPFMIIFFVLAGATLDIAAIPTIGLAGVLYLLLRSLGKVTGAWLGNRLARGPAATGHWAGIALLPQAGVAMGMALVASNHFPAYRDTILTIAIVTTVIFELLGPILTRLAITRVH